MTARTTEKVLPLLLALSAVVALLTAVFGACGISLDSSYEHLRGATQAQRVVLFCLIYPLAALALIGSGWVVWWFADPTAARNAYAWWSATLGTFLGAYYAYRTGAPTAWAFYVAAPAVAPASAHLAFHFPVATRWTRGDAWLTGLLGVWAAGCALATLMRVHYLLFMQLGMAVSTICLLLVPLRLARTFSSASVEQNAVVRPVFATFILVLSIAGALLVAGMFTWLRLDWALLWIPLAGALVAGAFTYALLRRQLIDLTAPLPHWVLAVSCLLGALFVVSIVGLVAWFVLPSEWLFYVQMMLSAAALFTLTAVGLRRLLDRLGYAGRPRLRLAFAHLGESLESVIEAEDVTAAFTHGLQRAVPTGGRVLGGDGLATLDPHVLRSLADGEVVVVPRQGVSPIMLTPVLCRGRLRAVLLTHPSSPGGVFTDDDRFFAQTVAVLVRLALDGRDLLKQEQEHARLLADSSQADKRVSLAMFGGEIAHEIGYSLAFFRSLVSQLRSGRTIDAEATAIGDEELGRLDRMLQQLRRLPRHEPRGLGVNVKTLLQRAERLLRDDIERNGVSCVLPSIECDVRGDADYALQIVVNLLRNAVQAVSPGGVVGIDVSQDGDGTDLIVWDSGPGFDAAIGARLFQPWTTTKPEGSGLGLFICQKLAAEMGWRISVSRRERTEIRVHIPLS